MSYCRWSSDDHQCDIYAWEDCGGSFVIEVASSRRTPKEPFPEHVSPKKDFDGWWARHQAVAKMIDDTESKPLGMAHDGERFTCDTPGVTADKMEYLRGLGYNVPQYAIDTLREEQEEMADAI
jgi:hypothetical protein